MLCLFLGKQEYKTNNEVSIEIAQKSKLYINFYLKHLEITPLLTEYKGRLLSI